MVYCGDFMVCEVNFEDVENDLVFVMFFNNSIEVVCILLKFIFDYIKLFFFIGMGYVGICVLVKVC